MKPITRLSANKLAIKTLEEIGKRKFALGERPWCIECAQRILKEFKRHLKINGIEL